MKKFIDLVNDKSISPIKRGYIKRCFNNLSNKSSNKLNESSSIDDYLKIIDEWFFIPSVNNFRVVSGCNCELCGRPENIYQFRLINKVNNNALWIGSSCIKNMDFQFRGVKTSTIKDDILSIFINKYKEKERKKKVISFIIFCRGDDIYLIKKVLLDKKITDKDLKNIKEGFYNKTKLKTLPDWFLKLV